MRKDTIKKAHITLRKTELGFIAIALIMVAFTAGFFTGRLRGGTVLKPEEIQTETPSVTSAAASPDGTKASPSSTPAYSKKININTADVSELKALPEIGDVIAGRIVAYRDANGGFKNIDEIMNVSGIGEKTFDKIRDQITVG